MKAADLHQVKTLIFGGGVTNNQQLHRLFSHTRPTITTVWPSAGLSLDNAAMIAGLGFHRYLKQGKGDPMELEALVRIPFIS